MYCHTLVLPVDEGIDGVGKAAGQAVHGMVGKSGVNVVHIWLGDVVMKVPALH